MSVVLLEECNVMVNSEELIGTTEYLSLDDVSPKLMMFKLGSTVYFTKQWSLSRMKYFALHVIRIESETFCTTYLVRIKSETYCKTHLMSV